MRHLLILFLFLFIPCYSFAAKTVGFYAYTEHVAAASEYSQEYLSVFNIDIPKRFGSLYAGIGIYHGRKVETCGKHFRIRKIVNKPSVSLFWRSNEFKNAGFRVWFRTGAGYTEIYAYPYVSLPLLSYGNVSLSASAGRGGVFFTWPTTGIVWQNIAFLNLKIGSIKLEYTHRFRTKTRHNVYEPPSNALLITFSF